MKKQIKGQGDTKKVPEMNPKIEKKNKPKKGK